jgi:hypothetical protein
MAVIIILALVVIVAVALIGFAVHLLFSPWLLLVAIAALAWVMLRPRRSRR